MNELIIATAIIGQIGIVLTEHRLYVRIAHKQSSSEVDAVFKMPYRKRGGKPRRAAAKHVNARLQVSREKQKPLHAMLLSNESATRGEVAV